MMEMDTIQTYGDVLVIGGDKGNSDFTFGFSLKPYSDLSSRDNLIRIAESLQNFYMVCNRDDEKLTSLFTVITGELIENAVKYSNPESPSIEYEFINYDKFYYLNVKNKVDSETAGQFNKFLEEFTSCDINAMIKDKIKQNALYSPDKSQLGLLKLKKDFNANIRVTIKLHSYKSQLYDVFVEAVLKKREEYIR